MTYGYSGVGKTAALFGIKADLSKNIPHPVTVFYRQR